MQTEREISRPDCRMLSRALFNHGIFQLEVRERHGETWRERKRDKERHRMKMKQKD